jgi:hypothetical protein
MSNFDKNVCIGFSMNTFCLHESECEQTILESMVVSGRVCCECQDVKMLFYRSSAINVLLFSCHVLFFHCKQCKISRKCYINEKKDHLDLF